MHRCWKDATRLIDAWNERQAQRMPFLFASTITALAARHWLWVYCLSWHTTRDVDLRRPDRNDNAADPAYAAESFAIRLRPALLSVPLEWRDGQKTVQGQLA
jgi:hypothetical protein